MQGGPPRSIRIDSIFAIDSIYRDKLNCARQFSPSTGEMANIRGGPASRMLALGDAPKTAGQPLAVFDF